MKSIVPQQHQQLPTRTSSRVTNSVYASKRRSPSITSFKAKDSPKHSLRRTSSHTLASQLQKQRAILQILTAQNSPEPSSENEYREEIRSYMKMMEVQTMGVFESVDSQPEIHWEMRPILIDFLVEVHFARHLRPETLYLAINLLDRYLSRRVVLKKHYQLVGCAALWIAAKFEDAKDAVPSLEYLAFMSGDAYDACHFVQMEYHILSSLDFALGHPSAENWLRFGLDVLEKEDDKVQSVARCVMEQSLYHADFLEVTSSAVAEGAILLARAICGRPPSVYSESEDAVSAAELIDFHLGENMHHLTETFIKKYSYACYHSASKVVLEWYQAGNRYVSAARCQSPAPSSISSMDEEFRSRSISRTPSLMCDTSSESMYSMDSVDSPCISNYSEPVTPMTPQAEFPHGKENYHHIPLVKSNLGSSQYGLGFEMPVIDEGISSSSWRLHNITS